MKDRYPPINPKSPVLLHGGDYNPDQWYPEVWEEDMRLMKLAHCNAMTRGDFRLDRAGARRGRVRLRLAGPRHGHAGRERRLRRAGHAQRRPPRMAGRTYPEVLRVRPDRRRNLSGAATTTASPRPSTARRPRAINTRLAERYRDHPALLVWHLSNEYSGECHCDMCQAAFRGWLTISTGPSTR